MFASRHWHGYFHGVLTCWSEKMKTFLYIYFFSHLSTLVSWHVISIITGDEGPNIAMYCSVFFFCTSLGHHILYIIIYYIYWFFFFLHCGSDFSQGLLQGEQLIGFISFLAATHLLPPWLQPPCSVWAVPLLPPVTLSKGAKLWLAKPYGPSPWQTTWWKGYIYWPNRSLWKHTFSFIGVRTWGVQIPPLVVGHWCCNVMCLYYCLFFSDIAGHFLYPGCTAVHCCPVHFKVSPDMSRNTIILNTIHTYKFVLCKQGSVTTMHSVIICFDFV